MITHTRAHTHTHTHRHTHKRARTLRYRKLKRHEAGRKLFESILERFERTEIPVSTYTSAIGFCVEDGNVERVCLYITFMHNIAFGLYRRGVHTQALDILGLIECKDAFVYQGVIGMFVKAGRTREAGEMILTMLDEGLVPSAEVYNVTLANIAFTKYDGIAIDYTHARTHTFHHHHHQHHHP